MAMIINSRRRRFFSSRRNDWENLNLFFPVLETGILPPICLVDKINRIPVSFKIPQGNKKQDIVQIKRQRELV